MGSQPAPETVLNLFDSSWFYLSIFENQSKSPIPETNPNPQIPNAPRPLTIHTRSKTQITNSSADTMSSLPNTPKPHLQAILSEKEFISPEIPKTRDFTNRAGRQKKRFSKSLSELEFEEMKGLMDLGFVFSEEDKEDSNLMEIVPGLQKLGCCRSAEESCGGPRARPYLSEAWEVESPLTKWRLPAVGNEIDMKDSLKWWAHTVASAVR